MVPQFTFNVNALKHKPYLFEDENHYEINSNAALEYKKSFGKSEASFYIISTLPIICAYQSAFGNGS